MGFWVGFERWGEKERKTVNMAVKEKTWDCIHSWLIVGEIDSVGQQGKGSSFIFLSWFGILWIIGVIVVFSMIFFHRILENLFYNCVLCQVKCFLKTKMPPTFSMVGIPYPLRKSKPMYQKKQSKPPNFRSSRKKKGRKPKCWEEQTLPMSKFWSVAEKFFLLMETILSPHSLCPLLNHKSSNLQSKPSSLAFSKPVCSSLKKQPTKPVKQQSFSVPTNWFSHVQNGLAALAISLALNYSPILPNQSALASEFNILNEGPPQESYVLDDAGVLSRVTKSDLKRLLSDLESRKGYHINVVTVRKLTVRVFTFSLWVFLCLC